MPARFDKKPWLLVFLVCLVSLIAIYLVVHFANQAQTNLKHDPDYVVEYAYDNGLCGITGWFEGYTTEEPTPKSVMGNTILYEPGEFYGVYKETHWGFSLAAGETAEMFARGDKVFVKIRHFNPDTRENWIETRELHDIIA